MFKFKKYLANIASILMFSLSTITIAATTDIAQQPLSSNNSIKPNVIFTLDDSGSMDWEVLLNTSSGTGWYLTRDSGTTRAGYIGCGYRITNNSNGSLTDQCNATNVTNGVFNFYTGSNNNYFQMGYLFPGDNNRSNRLYSITNIGVIPPLPAFSYFRSSDYNPMYYNSNVTYKPWISTKNYTFGKADPISVKSHPIYGNTTFNLTEDYDPSNIRNIELGYIVGARTVIPSGSKVWSNNRWTTINSNMTVGQDDLVAISIPHYFATYYNIDNSCTAANVTAGVCALAPNGTTRLRKYEIKPTTLSYPSGRSYIDEMQNFANWFQYYRKRNLMLAGSMSEVLPELSGVYSGITTLSNGDSGSPTNITTYDLETQGFSEILEPIYLNSEANGTPTKTALRFVGEQFKNNSSIIKTACQKNSNIVLTDGYANANGPTMPAYNRNTYGSGAPYTTHYTNSLADTALYYFTNNIRPSITPTGIVPKDSTSVNEINPDFNSDLHLNTYVITLGSTGLLYGNSFYGVGKEATAKAFQTPPSWPAPTISGSPTSIDDLWHATINGRGTMFTATNPEKVKVFSNDILNDILSKSQARAAVAVSTVNITETDRSIYVSSYNAVNWYGELAAYKINATSGQVNTNSIPDWSAQKQTELLVPANRKIVTYSAGSGVEFSGSEMPASYLSSLNTNITSNDNLEMIKYLRGDKSKEIPLGTYRKRNFILGDIVNAEPVFVRTAIAKYDDPGYTAFASSISGRSPMVYQPANDGMIHAFDANTGIENWAYIPSIIIPNLKKLASSPYSHQYYVDATPTFADVDFANTAPTPGATYTPNWKTILVGGLKAGGKGYYALDITTPKVSNIAQAKAKVLWEFPNSSTPVSSANNVGLTFGKPIITKTARHGWVVLLTSGYNNTTGDGKGHLFVVNAKTGELLQDIVTTAGSVGSPSGLSSISALTTDISKNATSDYAYGGDLEGNLWKFDLTANPYSVSKMAQLKNASNQNQPITTAPEIGMNSENTRMLFIGTGKSLGNTDLTNTQIQSIYGIVDSNSSIANVRDGTLLQKTVTVDADTTRHVSKENVNWATQKGWYFDLPSSGERLNGEIQLIGGVLVFATNIPSPVACSSTGFLYSVNANNGGELPPQAFVNSGLPPGFTYSGKSLGVNLTSRPVLIQLPNGNINGLLHNADNSVLSIQLPTSTKVTPRVTSWKELLRQ